MISVVFGSSGGIGRALCEGLVQRGAGPVYGVSRSAPEPIEGVTALRADFTRETDLESVAAEIAQAGPPGLVIVASGVLSDGAGLQPEKSLRQQNLSAFEQVFAANTIAPALIARHMIPIMPRKGRAVFAALSARVGSISDNRLGGWHAYRASKAALNMLLRNYAIEQAHRNREFVVAGLHPGTVDTPLSQPFQANVPDTQLFTPAFSANALLSVLDGLKPDESGGVFDYAGRAIPA